MSISKFAALLPDGRILLSSTQQGAMKQVAESGFHGEMVVEQGASLRARRNESEVAEGAESLHLAARALARGGLPARLSREEVMSMPLKEAVTRMHRIFRFLCSERTEKGPTGTQQWKLAPNAPEWNRITKDLAKRRGNLDMSKNWGAIYGPVEWAKLPSNWDKLPEKSPAVNRVVAEYAEALIGINLKLVKGTTTPSSPYSYATEQESYLIGINLFPADKLIEDGPDSFRRRYAFTPFAQIVSSIVKTGRVPEKVFNVASGEKHHIEEEDLNLLPYQAQNLEKAFSSRTWTMCAGASDHCKNACLVYTGQNTAAYKNDWKKASALLSLIADPAAYVRLVHEAIRRGNDSVNRGHQKRLRELAKSGNEAAFLEKQRFFVRMNLLSDIPWEMMIPWLFQDFPEVEFYDYTKIMSRNPERVGVKNYNLTYSYSGSNARSITQKLYGPEEGWVVEDGVVKKRPRHSPERAAVVFLGYLLEDGTGVRIAVKRPEGEQGYGYGLPMETDVFAWPALKGTPEGMLLVVNADKHDARPLDPPNKEWNKSTIAGLIFKSPGGGQTLTKSRMETARKAAESAFVLPTEIIPATAALDIPSHRFVSKALKNGKRGRSIARINGQRVVGIILAPETPRFEGPAGNSDSGVG